MRSSRSVIIVGAGHAGGRLAGVLRQKGFEGGIQLVGEEIDEPYERPPLSKEVLTTGADATCASLYPTKFYTENDIDIVLNTRVTSLDVATRQITTAHGTRSTASAIVLACGARPRSLAVPGVDRDVVYFLRNAVDARRLAPLLESQRRVCIIGGGFIGLEVAASAARRGCKVTILEVGSHLLARLLPREISEFVSGLHLKNEVTIRYGCMVKAVEHYPGELTSVILAGGEKVHAELVVVAIGAVPNAELALESGLPCINGAVATDRYGRTAVPGFYAIGDLAYAFNPWVRTRLRLESWDNAEQQARVVAAGILGEDVSLGGVPWFWTDVYDRNIQVLGVPGPFDATVTRGRIGERGSCLFRLKGQRIVFAVLIDAGRDRRPVQDLMMRRAKVDSSWLSDQDRPLRELRSSILVADAMEL